jgi:branched-chain amino acid transport system permease protein
VATDSFSQQLSAVSDGDYGEVIPSSTNYLWVIILTAESHENHSNALCYVFYVNRELCQQNVAHALQGGTPMEQFLANGICRGSVFALVALGFGLIYSTTKVFHLAHASVFVGSGYALFASHVLWGWPLLPAVIFVLALAGCLGMLIEWAVYQPLNRKGASSTVILLSSLGVQIMLVNLISLIFGSQTQILQSGIEPIVHLGAVILTRIQLFQVITAFAVLGGLWWFLHATNLGRTFRAIADDEPLASVLGIPVEKIRMAAFAVGSVLCGIGAILIASDTGIEPYAGFPAILIAAVACIIGGMNHFTAPALGGFFLGITQSLIIWKTSARWAEAVTFGILILFLMFRPQGLLGTVKRVEEA